MNIDLEVLESSYWNNLRVLQKWEMYPPSRELYKVNNFDDGNGKYSQLDNQWRIYGEGFNGGKVALINRYLDDNRIESISRWKINFIEDDNIQDNDNPQ
tara:strand:+ start:324 stop:620 length:297 start_codon:yes stop_codon:yes gene_type:complete